MNTLTDALLGITLGAWIALSSAHAATQKVQNQTSNILSESHSLPKNQIITLPPVEVKATPIKLSPIQIKLIEDFKIRIKKSSANELGHIIFHHEYLKNYISKVFPENKYANTDEVQRELLFHDTMVEYAKKEAESRHESAE